MLHISEIAQFVHAYLNEMMQFMITIIDLFTFSHGSNWNNSEGEW